MRSKAGVNKHRKERERREDLPATMAAGEAARSPGRKQRDEGIVRMEGEEKKKACCGEKIFIERDECWEREKNEEMKGGRQSRWAARLPASGCWRGRASVCSGIDQTSINYSIKNHIFFTAKSLLRITIQSRKSSLSTYLEQCDDRFLSKKINWTLNTSYSFSRE